MMPPISRSVPRFDPIHGDTRYRVPPRPMRRLQRQGPGAAAFAVSAFSEAPSSSDMRQFLTAFAGGLLFFSILIF